MQVYDNLVCLETIDTLLNDLYYRCLNINETRERQLPSTIFKPLIMILYLAGIRSEVLILKDNRSAFKDVFSILMAPYFENLSLSYYINFLEGYINFWPMTSKELFTGDYIEPDFQKIYRIHHLPSLTFEEYNQMMAHKHGITENEIRLYSSAKCLLQKYSGMCNFRQGFPLIWYNLETGLLEFTRPTEYLAWRNAKIDSRFIDLFERIKVNPIFIELIDAFYERFEEKKSTSPYINLNSTHTFIEMCYKDSTMNNSMTILNNLSINTHSSYLCAAEELAYSCKLSYNKNVNEVSKIIYDKLRQIK